MERSEIQKIRNDLTEILKVYGDEAGLQFEIGRIVFGQMDFRCQLKAVKAGNPEEVLKMEWNENCWRVGMTDKDFGRKFRSLDGELYKLIAVKAKSRRYPIIAQNEGNGKRYKFPKQYVIQALKDRGE